MGNIPTRFVNHQKLNSDYRMLEKKYEKLEKKYNTLLHKQLHECVKNEFSDITNTLNIILKSKNDEICV